MTLDQAYEKVNVGSYLHYLSMNSLAKTISNLQCDLVVVVAAVVVAVVGTNAN